MSTVLTMNLSEDLKATLKAAGYSPQRLSDEARRYLAAGLFARKVLSLEQAGQLAEMDLWEFIPFLGEQGVSLADYDEEETEKELEAVRWLSKEQARS